MCWPASNPLREGETLPGKCLFLFRATLAGALWREAWTAILVDPVTGRAEPVPEGFGEGEVRLSESPYAGLSAAYDRAERGVREALQPVLKEWAAELHRRRAAAEEELGRYYRSALEEDVAGLRRVFHQVAVLRVRVTLARKAGARRQFRRELRRWEGELEEGLSVRERRAAGLATDLRRRQNEIARRYRGRVKVELVAAARVQPVVDNPPSGL